MSIDAPDRQLLRSRMKQLHWFHQIDFGDGLISPGKGALSTLKAQADVYFADGVAGKSVLDIGCWDGFNSVEASRRGASRVVATDHWVWANLPGVSRATIELAREYLAPNIEIMDISLPDLTVERVGQFDVVLFCGILYHLRDPLTGVETAAALAKDLLVVETLMGAADVPHAAAMFYPGRIKKSDPSKHWAPNRLCVETMLKAVGFRDISFTPHPTINDRGIFLARRN